MIFDSASKVDNSRLLRPICLLFVSPNLGSCLGYGMLGVAGDLPTLMFARILVGIVKQTQTLSTAYISEVTTPVQRTQALVS